MHILHPTLRPHSSSTSCPNNVLCSQKASFRIMSCIWLSLLSPSIWNSSSTYPWFLWSWHFWRLQAVILGHVPSSGVSLWGDSDYLSLAGTSQKWRCSIVLYPLLWAAILFCPITDYFTLITGWRWHLPGFFTVKTFPLLVINNYLWGATMFLLVCTKLSIYSLLIPVWNRDFLFDSKG